MGHKDCKNKLKSCFVFPIEIFDSSSFFKIFLQIQLVNDKIWAPVQYWCRADMHVSSLPGGGGYFLVKPTLYSIYFCMVQN